MSWLPQYPAGHTAAEYASQIQIPRGYPPSLLNKPTWQDQLANVIGQIGPKITQAIQSKKSNDIANTLLNMEQPPRAESVGPSVQGAPATPAATGGMPALRAQQMYQAYQNNQPDTATDDLNYRLLTANVTKAENAANRPATEQPMVDIGGRPFPVTPDAALAHQDRIRDKTPADSQESLNNDVLNTTGHKWSDWTNLIQTDFPHVTSDGPSGSGNNIIGHFQNKDGGYDKAAFPVQAFQRAQARSQALNGVTSSDLPGQSNTTQPAANAAASSSGLPVISTPQQAAGLPPGTKFQTPDGRIKIVPFPQGPAAYVPSTANY